VFAPLDDEFAVFVAYRCKDVRLVCQMSVNEGERQMQDNYSSVRKQTDNDEHQNQHQHPEEVYSRPPSLVSRALSEYSCRPNDLDDDNFDNAENREGTSSPVCIIV